MKFRIKPEGGLELVPGTDGIHHPPTREEKVNHVKQVVHDLENGITTWIGVSVAIPDTEESNLLRDVALSGRKEGQHLWVTVFLKEGCDREYFGLTVPFEATDEQITDQIRIAAIRRLKWRYNLN